MRTIRAASMQRPKPVELAQAEAVRRGATTFAARARSARAGVLSLNQTAVLGQLYRGGEMTPRELADQLRMLPQSLTRTFAALEASGWLRRVPDPSDGRQSLLTITGAGRAALADEMRPRNEWVAAAMASELTVAERELLVVAAGLLERLAYLDATPARREA